MKNALFQKVVPLSPTADSLIALLGREDWSTALALHFYNNYPLLGLDEQARVVAWLKRKPFHKKIEHMRFAQVFNEYGACRVPGVIDPVSNRLLTAVIPSHKRPKISGSGQEKYDTDQQSIFLRNFHREKSLTRQMKFQSSATDEASCAEWT